MTPTELVLSRLQNHRRSGNNYAAKCPAHDDRQASLSVGTGDDGRALLRCFAGCEIGDIVGALGLTLSDIMPPKPDTSPRRKAPKPTSGKPATPKADTSTSTHDGESFTSATAAVAALEKSHGKHAACWEYTDAQGDPIGLVVRWNKPDGGKAILPVSRNGTGWILGGMPKPRPLYRLPEILANTSATVYVTEGEKAADAAVELGFLATTSPGGSSGAAGADWSVLAGRRVVILPDADKPGRKYGAQVTEILSRLTPPADVRVVELPDLPDAGDIVDYTAANKDLGRDEIRRRIETLAEAATSAPATPGPVLVNLADVESCAVRWLWRGRLPLGRISLLVGAPGGGKSFLTTDMAARVSTGTPWPDGTPCPRSSAILVSAEDDPADTIRPRLDAHGADVRRVHLLAAVRRVDPESGKASETTFTLTDVNSLRQALERVPDCKLVIIDPIGSYMGTDADSYKDAEVRSVLAPVALLAQQHDAAVLVVAHRRKASAAFADDLAMGSRAFVGIARSVLHLSRDSKDRARRLLLGGKNNLSAESSGLAFTIEGHPPALVWEPDPVHLSADDGVAQEQAERKPGPDADARQAASDWLRELLADGGRPAAEVKAETDAAGLNWRTVHRAADSLGVVRRKSAFGTGWKWSLPAEDDTKVTGSPSTNILSSCHLRVFDPENADSEGDKMPRCQDVKTEGEPGIFDADAPTDDSEWGVI